MDISVFGLCTGDRRLMSVFDTAVTFGNKARELVLSEDHFYHDREMNEEAHVASLR